MQDLFIVSEATNYGRYISKGNYKEHFCSEGKLKGCDNKPCPTEKTGRNTLDRKKGEACLRDHSKKITLSEW